MDRKDEPKPVLCDCCQGRSKIKMAVIDGDKLTIRTKRNGQWHAVCVLVSSVTQAMSTNAEYSVRFQPAPTEQG